MSDPDAEELDKLIELLAHMRSRPGMHFGLPPYLRQLIGFTRGYSDSALISGRKDPFQLGPEFSRWLVEEKGLHGTSHEIWESILERNYETEEAAFDAFFDLFDAWRESPGYT